MKHNYDYIIIGSGFGGSVSALRLAEKGYKVLVVERGKWYQGKDFPKTNWNLPKWLWMPALRFFGIMKLSIFRHVAVLSGAGVGGGSLVYANTLPIPKKAFYTTGSWAKLNNWETALKPFYQLAYKMLGAAPNPHLADADLALKELAEQDGLARQFEPTKVAVYFGTPGQTQPDPYFGGEGPSRSGCIFCGGCMTGCRHNAKNTLDKNYLYLAQKKGAEILAEQEVTDVKPLDGASGATGYQVSIQSSTKYFKKKQSLTARGVVFSGGVIGTVKLLLQLKKRGSLPNLSDRLGHDVRTNNETLVSVSTRRRDLDFSRGLAIGSILHTDENTHLEVCRYSEGSGAWKFLHMPLSSGKGFLQRVFNMKKQFLSHPLHYLRIYTRSWSRHTVVLLFMQTLDSTLRLKLSPTGLINSALGSGPPPSADIPESARLTQKYAQVVNGSPTTFSLEALFGLPTTAHILGGAVMGETAQEGVIDRNNRVFGYQNMLVIDGSMISANPGVNPSLSITAIAEHAMSLVEGKKG